MITAVEWKEISKQSFWIDPLELQEPPNIAEWLAWLRYVRDTNPEDLVNVYVWLWSYRNGRPL